MKYRYLFIILFFISCSPINVSKYDKPIFSSKGFAYIYSNEDFENKIIKKKINTYETLVAHNKFSRGVLLKITNPKNGKNVILKNSFKLDYPDFYKILITQSIVSQIGLDENIPYVEVEEIKKIRVKGIISDLSYD